MAAALRLAHGAQDVGGGERGRGRGPARSRADEQPGEQRGNDRQYDHDAEPGQGKSTHHAVQSAPGGRFCKSGKASHRRAASGILSSAQTPRMDERFFS